MLNLKNPYVTDEYEQTMIPVWFYMEQYCEPENEKRMFLELVCNEYGYFEPWCHVTVNLPEYRLTDENCGFLDTNNAPYIIDFLIENKLGELTGRTARSGFCTYPEFRFDMQKITEHILLEE